MSDTQGLIEYGKFAIEILGGGSALAAILIKMGRMAGSFEEASRTQTEEIAEMKKEMTKLAELITAVAVQKVTIENLQSQITMITKWYDELRHGKGMIQQANGN